MDERMDEVSIKIAFPFCQIYSNCYPLICPIMLKLIFFLYSLLKRNTIKVLQTIKSHLSHIEI